MAKNIATGLKTLSGKQRQVWQIESIAEAVIIAKRLIERGAWFQVEPRPCNWFNFTVNVGVADIFRKNYHEDFELEDRRMASEATKAEEEIAALATERVQPAQSGDTGEAE